MEMLSCGLKMTFSSLVLILRFLNSHWNFAGGSAFTAQVKFAHSPSTPQCSDLAPCTNFGFALKELIIIIFNKTFYKK
jgi:hypothetical protein